MEVAWAWAFLDLPPDGFDEELAFWQQVTRTTLSPWRGEQGEFATLLPDEGHPWLKVQRVGGPGGVHLDLDVAVPLPQAREEVVALGATVLDELDDLVVCRSPGGFTFCLTASAPSEPGQGQVRAGQPSLLDQVCLDIPADRYAAELAFWMRLTGWLPPRPEPDDSGLLPLTRPDGMPLRLLTQRLGAGGAGGTRKAGATGGSVRHGGSVTAHVDLACADRAATTREHEALGARVESVHEGWTVLRAPGGRRYCVTERDPLTGVRG